MLRLPEGVVGQRRPLALGLIALLLFGVAQSMPVARSPLALIGLALATGAIAAGCLGAFRLTRPWTVGLAGLGAVGLQLLSPRSPSAIGAFVAVVGASMLPGRLGRALALASGLAYLGAIALTTDRPEPYGLAALGFGLLATYVGSSAVRQLRDQKARAERLLAELEVSREAQLRDAALAERARLAREIHDVLAHSLSALAIQLEVARLALAGGAEGATALAAVERAQTLTRQGLDDARRAVGTLREESAPGPEQLPRLVAELEQQIGAPCRFERVGPARQLPAESRLALARVAQEALTNVRRHAHPERVDVTLCYRPDAVELTVEDRAAAPARPATGPAGYGLLGMRERAELIGGRLDAAPTGDGFRVHLWLPA
jgi:signal transduction histidine kinase